MVLRKKCYKLANLKLEDVVPLRQEEQKRNFFFKDGKKGELLWNQ